MQEEKEINSIRNSDKPKFEKYYENSDWYCQKIEDDSINNPNNFGELNIQTFTPTFCGHKNSKITA